MQTRCTSAKFIMRPVVDMPRRRGDARRSTKLSLLRKMIPLKSTTGGDCKRSRYRACLLGIVTKNRNNLPTLFCLISIPISVLQFCYYISFEMVSYRFYIGPVLVRKMVYKSHSRRDVAPVASSRNFSISIVISNRVFDETFNICNFFENAKQSAMIPNDVWFRYVLRVEYTKQLKWNIGYTFIKLCIVV